MRPSRTGLTTPRHADDLCAAVWQALAIGLTYGPMRRVNSDAAGTFQARRMEDRSVAFLEIMIGIAVAAVIAFLILLTSLRARRAQGEEDASNNRSGKHQDAAALRSRWPQLLLAVAFLVVATLIVLWQFPPFGGSGAAESAWRTQPNALVFFIVMLAAGGLGLLAFLFYVFLRAQPPTTIASAEAAATPETTDPAGFASPAGTRLLGLLILAFAFLLLNWVYVPRALQYSMVLQLVYPAALAVALVLMFDKATRSWSAKNGGESFREWLLCDVVVFLLVLGFLNLLEAKSGDKYAALIWDVLHVVLFFGVFWLLDRTAARLRFLFAYAYLTGLPILLLIWREAQGVAAPPEQSWWSTIWPVFFLGVIFFVLELIAVIASRDRSKQALPAAKDLLFVVLLTVLLISAVPGSDG